MPQISKSSSLNIINPGFNRVEAVAPLESKPFPMFLIETATAMQPDTRPRLQWWESRLQAEAGIKALCTKPFLHVRRENEQEGYVSAQILYPDKALKLGEKDRISQAARSVSAYVRQAREMYTAAGAAGVTDVSRPLLYYYGALALVKAVISTLFGAMAGQGSHGLTCEPGPTDTNPAGSDWPTVIKWQQDGAFPWFYRAVRWDELFEKWDANKLPLNGKPQFHILECIRLVGEEWGTLTPTGFTPRSLSRANHGSNAHFPKEACLLLFRQNEPFFLNSQMPRNVPLFQVPQVIVQLMELYYFSMLARYHAATWQELLGGISEPEGYPFRIAAQFLPHHFAREVAQLLPYPHEQEPAQDVPWIEDKGTLLSDWYRYPSD